MSPNLTKTLEVIRLHNILIDAKHYVDDGTVSRNQIKECIVYAIEHGSTIDFAINHLGFVKADRPPYSIDEIVAKVLSQKSMAFIRDLFSDNCEEAVKEVVRQSIEFAMSNGMRYAPSLFEYAIRALLVAPTK